MNNNDENSSSSRNNKVAEGDQKLEMVSNISECLMEMPLETTIASANAVDLGGQGSIMAVSDMCDQKPTLGCIAPSRMIKVIQKLVHPNEIPLESNNAIDLDSETIGPQPNNEIGNLKRNQLTPCCIRRDAISIS